MRLPIRKSGEYAAVPPDPYLTQNKYNQLTNLLAKLKGQQPQAISEVKRLAELGDFSENAAYQMAKGRLRGLLERILGLENQLKTAIIIEPQANSQQVVLGSQVTVSINHQQKVYLILGSSEVDLTKGIISHNSPLGQALLGKKAGDEFAFQTPQQKVVGEIISIN